MSIHEDTSDQIKNEAPKIKEDDKFWWLLLCGLAQDSVENDWKDFVDQLYYTNRFSSSHKIVKLIRAISEHVTLTIPAGTILYRARIYRDNLLDEFIEGIYKSQAKKQGDPKDTQSIDWNKSRNTFIYPMIGLIGQKDKMKHVREEYRKWLRRRFKGFNRKDSDMPPQGKATEGRVNPEKISYLYVSEDPKTSIYEVRPIIGQYVSVAQIKVYEDLKIYDLDHAFPEGFKIDDDSFSIALYKYIGQQFSKPYTSKPLQYLPTQYIGEMIKQMGFDGLRFNSSLCNGGKNIVLFDNKHCKPISSDYVQVSGIDMTFNNPEMYQIEDMVNGLQSSM